MAKNAEDRYQSAWGIKADEATLLEVGGHCWLPLCLKMFQTVLYPQKLYGREAEITLLAAKRVVKRIL